MSDVNIKSLAKALNLSPSTVSRALRDSYEISEETKLKVRQLAEKLKYKPNPYAKSLRDNQSKTIAIILPDMLNNYFSQVIDGVQQVVQQYGYHLLIYLTNEEEGKEREVISHLFNGRVDGVMMSLSSKTQNIDHLEELYRSGIPLIFFDRICDEIPTTKFTTDDYESALKATRHLIESGCRQIAYLMLSKDISICKNRMRGYKDALIKSGIGQDDTLMVACGNDEEENYNTIKDLLLKTKPDGILASVEKFAISTYYVCKDYGIKIPQDLKIVSFSNLKIASLLNPSLTTISQPTLQLGRDAAELLMKKLKKEGKTVMEERVIVLPSQLNIRNSTTGESAGLRTLIKE